MNILLKSLILLLAVSLFACDQDEEPMLSPESLSGEWTYDEDQSIVLDFYEDDQMRVGGEEFAYELSGNVLTLQYNGPLFILLPPSEHRIRVTNDFIWMDNLEELAYFEEVDDEGVFRK